MAQVTIAQLPQASTPLTGLELIPIVQNGVTKQTITNSLIALTSGVISLTGTTNQVIVSNPTGAVTLSLPQNINSGAAPVFVGTNFTNIPNSAFSNSSITIGSTNIVLGGTALTIAGLTSLTSGSLAANGSISGSSATGAISIGTLTYSDTNTFESLQTNANSYAQLVLQNTNSGSTASTDFVVSNDLGTASTYYGNFGINSSVFTGSGSYYLPNATYLSSTTGDLSIGTTTSNAIHFFVNNGTTDAMTISSAGAVTIPSLSVTTATITGGSINGTSVGATTASTGAFTALSANGAVSGTGFTNLFSSPPSIGSTAAGSGSFTNLSASGAVSGTGFSNYLASPPAIGGTAAAAGSFTTLTSSGLFTPSTTNGIKGTTLGDSPNAGSVGEYATATSTSVALTSGVTANATSVSLTAGDWDVWGVVVFIPAGTTTTSYQWAGIGTVSAANPGYGNYVQQFISGTTGQIQILAAPMQRVNVSATTTFYLVAQMGFAVSTATCNGYIYARRRR